MASGEAATNAIKHAREGVGEVRADREEVFLDRAETLDPRTRKRMPNPSVELPADAPAAIIQVRDVDSIQVLVQALDSTSGELVTGGSKLVGSAQVRENGALLQHGSILIEDDQHLITQLLADPESVEPAPRAATLASALGRVPPLCAVRRRLRAPREERTGLRVRHRRQRLPARHDRGV